MQVREMRRAYKPLKDQATASAKSAAASKEAADVALKQVQDAENALKLAQRAWVGPNRASLTAEPQAGKPIDVNIIYQNTGREPALNFAYDLDAFVMAQSGNITETIAARMGSYEQTCQTARRPTGGSIVYPTTGLSSYTLSDTLPSGTIDGDFSSGREILVSKAAFGIAPSTCRSTPISATFTTRRRARSLSTTG